jgi:hypothetical protein
MTYGSQALSLTLLGRYLVAFGEGDVRRLADIRELLSGETLPGRHARRVLASYARVYDGKPELDILKALGYFDGPAEPALRNLYDARLTLVSDLTQQVDCHPLIRETLVEYLP